MVSTKHNLSNLVQLLKMRGFFELSQVAINFSGKHQHMFDYGPLGTLLRRNILNKWWELMVCQQRNVFAVERPFFETSQIPSADRLSESSSDILYRRHLQQDCFSKYLQVLKLANGRLPFSIASVGPSIVLQDSESREPEEKLLLLGGCSRTQMLLQNYTAPSGINAVFDYWLQLRLSWWKKFARNPSKFSVVSASSSNNLNSNKVNDSKNSSQTSFNESNEIKNGSQSQISMCIVYEFPWGQETVECVSNLGDKYLKRLEEREDDSNNYKGKISATKSCLPHCIECDTNIEMATAAWLVDSFSERQPSSTKKGKSNMVLQLHNQLAPYQASIVVSSSSSPLHEIHHVCTHLEKDLQESGISVFNTVHQGSTLNAHLRRNDQLGIPYTIIVDDNTVTDGLVNTRNRDTAVFKESHISSIGEELAKNLTAELELPSQLDA